MPTVSINDADVYFQDEGAGTAVILVHSSSSASGQWRALIGLLQGRFRCLAPDLVGYGRTDAWDPDRGSELYDDELAILNHLIDAAGEPVHLVGHSYGGMLATLATLNRPQDVRTLTVIEPTLFTFLRETGETEAFADIEGVARRTRELTLQGEHEAAARAFLDYWVAPGALDAMPGPTRAAVVATMDKLRHEWPFWRDMKLPGLDDLRAIACPVLVVRAERTTLAASRTVDVILPVLENAEYAEIDGAGHMSPLTHPHKVNPVIQAFLAKHAG